MEQDAGPAIPETPASGDALPGLVQGLLEGAAGPGGAAMAPAVAWLLITGLAALPVACLALAVAGLRMQADHHALRTGLALSSGLACTLWLLYAVAPHMVPRGPQAAILLPFLWLFLYGWMLLDTVRLARHDDFRPAPGFAAVGLALAMIVMALFLSLPNLAP